MTEQGVILNRLLDKYENSKHLSEPGTSTRRVMLRIEKKELPEYLYEDAAIRDSYNEAAWSWKSSIWCSSNGLRRVPCFRPLYCAWTGSCRAMPRLNECIPG